MLIFRGANFQIFPKVDVVPTNPESDSKVIYDGKKFQFPTWIETKPIDQAKARASWLSKWISEAVGEKIWLGPVITIPGWYIERVRKNGMPVLNPKQVPFFLKSQKVVHPESTIKRISHQIELRCRNIEPGK